MIIDTLANAAGNAMYPRVIRETLQAIQRFDLDTLAPGKYSIEGDAVYFSLMAGETRPFHEQRPEFHRQYIDIHLVLAGEEIIGAGTLGRQPTLVAPFDDAHDIGFCQRIDAETLIGLNCGDLAVIFPPELHRPMCTLDAPAPLRKIVAKIDRALLTA